MSEIDKNTPQGNIGYSQDFETEIAKGNVKNHSFLNGMGERQAIGTTVNGEDMWRGNELSPAPTSTTTIPIPSSSGEQMSVTSEHSTDTIDGVGVQKINVDYLDINGDQKSVVLDMDGIGLVDLPADVIFINNMNSAQVGSNGTSVGNIKVHNKDTVGLVYNMIQKGTNQSVVPNRMIPAGHILVLKGWHTSEAKGKRVNMRIRSTDHDGVLLPGVFTFKDTSHVAGSSSGELKLNDRVPALSIVKITGWADTAGADSSCHWWGKLIKIDA